MRILSHIPHNAEVDFERLDEPITPASAFFKRNHYDAPESSGEWFLAVNGRRVSLSELRKLPFRRLEATIECAGNGRTLLNPVPPGTPWRLGAVSNGVWGGTSLRNVLSDVQGLEVIFQGADQGHDGRGAYARSLTLGQAMHEDVLLCWEMNDHPLPREHGGPLRLVVPGQYGMASVKWLCRIDLASSPYEGYYQREDYQIHIPGQSSRPVGAVRPRALIVRSSATEVSGWAWSGTGPVVEVEVLVGEKRLRAELAPDRGPYAWRRFRCPLQLEPGRHLVRAVARDAAGNVQPLDPFWNEHGYENNCAEEHVLEV
ncbi:MAG: sulfite oxidase [Candidatus Xenobia bacterium]